MKHFIDGNNQIFAFEDDGSQDHLIAPGMTFVSAEEMEAILVKPKTKAERIAALTVEYKADIDVLQAGWASAAFSGGATESAKKATLVQQAADRKVKYNADVAAIRAQP